MLLLAMPALFASLFQLIRVSGTLSKNLGSFGGIFEVERGKAVTCNVEGSRRENDQRRSCGLVFCLVLTCKEIGQVKTFLEYDSRWTRIT
jgi:hypothetical protein